jgi:hypothetical protein
LLEPIRKLRKPVYSIIVPSLGELQQLNAEVLEPLDSARQMHVASLDLCRLSMHRVTLSVSGVKAIEYGTPAMFSRSRSWMSDIQVRDLADLVSVHSAAGWQEQSVFDVGDSPRSPLEVRA